MAETSYLKLVIFPSIVGVYRRDITAALVGSGGNMEKIDAAMQAFASAFGGLAKVATSGSYADLADTPDIPNAVPIATAGVPGKVMPDGITVEVAEDGTLKALLPPVASGESAGIVKPDGTTVMVDGDGVLKALLPGLATAKKAGLVMPDGVTIKLGADGKISVETVPLATTKKVGTVKPDGESITIDVDGTLHAGVPTDVYTRAEVDDQLNRLSNLLVPADMLAALYTATNAILDETNVFDGLGGSLIAIDKMTDEILS